MSELDAGESRAGCVQRSGKTLRVMAPADMPSHAWRSLGQELVMFAEALPVGDREYRVPVHQAASLDGVLAQPWPAGRWPWTWSGEALRAKRSVGSVDGTVRTLLAAGRPSASEVDEVREGLVAEGFARTLLPAQAAAVASLVRSSGGGNFSVPGSGKTTMTYAVFSLLRCAGRVDRMLVVAPQSAYEAWIQEAEDCFDVDRRPTVEVTPRLPRRRTEVVVANYERVANGTFRAAADQWLHGRRALVVFDEAHRAKRGESGLHGRGASDLTDLAEARMVLTGTPMPNGPDDLAAILDLAYPGQGKRLADPATPGASRTWVRITKDELGLDPAEVRVERMQLDSPHQRLYRALEDGLAGDAAALQARPDLASRAFMRLLACASNPALLAGQDEDADLSWPRSLPGEEAPLTELLADLGGAARPVKLLGAARHAREHVERGQKLLIWTNFIGNAHALAGLLAPHKPAVITGAVPLRDPGASTDRERELRRFREDPDCHVLIATPQTLGEGVSLHRVCQSQLHVDRSYNAGLYLQTLDRTHRVGMPEGTRARVTVLIAEGTVDQDVEAALIRKMAKMDSVLDDPTLRRLAMPDFGEPADLADADDVDALLRHLRAG
jgi:hypothetical protein